MKKVNEKGITLIFVVSIIVLFIIVGTILISVFNNKTTEGKSLKDMTNTYSNEELTNNINDSHNEKEKNANKLSTIWFGDSLIYGTGNNGLGFPEMYYGVTSKLSEQNFGTIGGWNVSREGATINIGNHNNCIYDQVKYVIDEIKKEKIDASNLDLIILSGGGNDILNYYKGSPYNIPITSKAGKTSVIQYFETTLDKVLEFKKLDNVNKNLKIIYLQTVDYSNEHINNIWSKYFKEYVSNADEYLKIYLERSKELSSSIIETCKEYEIEYFDITKYITESDDKYYIEDCIHYNKYGYEQLNKFIIEKFSEL